MQVSSQLVPPVSDIHWIGDIIADIKPESTMLIEVLRL
jgi:hypothetical protein